MQLKKLNRMRERHLLYFPIYVMCFLSILGLLLSCTQNTQQTPTNTSGNAEIYSLHRGEITPAQCEVFEAGSTCGVKQEIKSIIEEFLTEYHNAEAALQSKDLTLYFAQSNTQSYENALMNQAALDLLIQTRQMQEQDLRMTACSATVEYLFCEEEENTLTVLLKENQEVQFACLDVTSQTNGIWHSFVFSKSGNDYEMVSHERYEDLFLLVEEEYQEQTEDLSRTMSEIKQAMNDVTQTLLEESKQNISLLLQEKETYLGSPEDFDIQRLSCDVEYNREEAVSYAMKWWNQRNEEWMEYDDLGGNCNNFISQCLYAAGIPMDYEGESTVQWKWYSDDINLSESDWGRVPSWTGVSAFYDYCGLNEGSGLCGWVNENVFSAQPGDIIQFGAADEWRHSVIVTDRIYDENGEVVDFLIASNTTDRVNYPLSAYGYTSIRLLRIYGYNQ